MHDELSYKRRKKAINLVKGFSGISLRVEDRDGTSFEQKKAPRTWKKQEYIEFWTISTHGNFKLVHKIESLYPPRNTFEDGAWQPL